MLKYIFVGIVLGALLATSSAKRNEKGVSVLTWNVLAQIYDQFSVPQLNAGTLDPALIDEDMRAVMQIHNIKKHNSDIMCLQEMDEYRYNKFVEEFGDEYGSWFAPHGADHWADYVNSNQTNVPNGNALFYRKSKLNVLHYGDFQLSENQNTAALAVFQPRGCSTKISTACIHVQDGVSPDVVQLRATQLAAVLTKFEEIRIAYDIDVEIITGDFNETPAFPGSANIVANGFKNVFEAMGAEQPSTFYGFEVFFNTTIFPLDYIYFKTYGSVNVTVDEATVPDVTDEMLSFASHIDTMEALLEQVMKFKSDKIRSTSASYLEYMTKFVAAFEKVRPKTTPLPDWIDDLRTRAFRMGSDHILVESDFVIKKNGGGRGKWSKWGSRGSSRSSHSTHSHESNESSEDYDLN